MRVAVVPGAKAFTAQRRQQRRPARRISAVAALEEPQAAAAPEAEVEVDSEALYRRFEELIDASMLSFHTGDRVGWRRPPAGAHAQRCRRRHPPRGRGPTAPAAPADVPPAAPAAGARHGGARGPARRACGHWRQVHRLLPHRRAGAGQHPQGAHAGCCLPPSALCRASLSPIVPCGRMPRHGRCLRCARAAWHGGAGCSAAAAQRGMAARSGAAACGIFMVAWRPAACRHARHALQPHMPSLPPAAARPRRLRLLLPRPPRPAPCARRPGQASAPHFILRFVVQPAAAVGRLAAPTPVFEYLPAHLHQPPQPAHLSCHALSLPLSHSICSPLWWWAPTPPATSL